MPRLTDVGKFADRSLGCVSEGGPASRASRRQEDRTAPHCSRSLPQIALGVEMPIAEVSGPNKTFGSGIKDAPRRPSALLGAEISADQQQQRIAPEHGEDAGYLKYAE